jgi:signal transduction histidine kinase/CheY-like chemotaxis protein
MQGLSIARSLRLALAGLTVVLAVVAVLGLGSLYSSRQRYDDTLVHTSQLASAAANLATAGIVEQEVLRDVRGPAARAARQQAATAYGEASGTALQLARSDAASLRLVEAQISQENEARALAGSRLTQASAVSGPLARARALATALQNRQAARQVEARNSTRSSSRRAIVLIAVAGGLALVAALALIAALVGSMCGPLDALVVATRRLAAGDLSERVTPTGPQELRDLGNAFNAMGDDLARATARIEQERARLAVTIASLGDALIVTDPRAPNTVAGANPRAVQLLPELTAGSAVDGPGSPLPPLGEAIQEEIEIEHHNRTLAVTAARLGADGTDAGIVWTVRDISERARLERAKSEFVATASHELRSPLTSIKGFVELLARSPGNMSDQQREFVDIILRSTDRLVELVNDLLDLARIDADRVEIDRRPIDVGEAVREVVELMGARFATKRQSVSFEISQQLPLALADAGRVRQIVANLLTNAHQYTPEGGSIRARTALDRGWVAITVSDTGVGMTDDEAERVFERFFRAADSHASPGTGLGMSIVKSLVDLHGGRIELQTAPGAGTRFTVFLPAAIPGLGADGLAILRGRRVLVVDDELDIAKLIRDQLEPFEVDCTLVTSGEEALARLRGGGFDAVTLDILMPERDGFDVLQTIRNDAELRATPVVFVSVFFNHDALAGEWVVPKPINAQELRGVLSAAVSAGRTRVLVVGRDELRATLEPALRELGIEHQWETSGAAAARVCGERHFEVALVDVGLRNPQAVLRALDLRGRRVRRAVILFTDGVSPAPAGIERLGLEVVPVHRAAGALLATLDRAM